MCWVVFRGFLKNNGLRGLVFREFGNTKLEECLDTGLGMQFYDRFLQIRQFGNMCQSGKKAGKKHGLAPKSGPQSLERRSNKLDPLPSDSEIWRSGDWEDLGDMRI